MSFDLKYTQPKVDRVEESLTLGTSLSVNCVSKSKWRERRIYLLSFFGWGDVNASVDAAINDTARKIRCNLIVTP